MYNRQQQQQPQPQQDQAPLPNVLEEQYELPIFKIVRELREGRTLKISMRTQEGFYITAVNGGGGVVVANAIKIGGNETFWLIPQGASRDKVAIQTANGNYLSAIDGGGKRVDATSTTIGPNELFKLIPVTPDQANFVTTREFLLLVLTTEPRLLTAYGVATGPRTNIRIVPQV